MDKTTYAWFWLIIGLAMNVIVMIYALYQDYKNGHYKRKDKNDTSRQRNISYNKR